MFPWCKTVNVFNIENHYHFYSQNAQKEQNNKNLSFNKLKPCPITITKGQASKISSKSCNKRGLNLSKNLDFLLNTELSHTMQKPSMHRQPDNRAVSYHNKISQQAQSQTCYYPDLYLYKTGQNDMLTLSKQIIKPQSISTQTQTMINTQCQSRISHKIINKYKPSLDLLNNNLNKVLKQQNNMLLTKLYSTQSGSNYLVNSYPHYRQIRNTIQLTNLPIPNKSETLELSTSRNLCSRQKTQSFINQIDGNIIDGKSTSSHSQSRYHNNSTSDFGYNNSRYNASRSLSASAAVANQNQGIYYRIMETSRGEARQASIILSNILSRGSQNCYSSMHMTPNRLRVINDKRILFQDKQTILSHENDMSSQSQLKIQQSQINDIDPRNNFILIPEKKFENSGYIINLAIQNTMKCLVSLKQIGFCLMSSISQQLQIYQFIDHLKGTDSYHNILQLYQVQMTASSYILIKQPYTDTLYNYIKVLPSHLTSIAFQSQFHQIVLNIINQFGQHMMYPWRHLNIKDFVVCGDCVVKLHDLSIFRSMKQPMFNVNQLLNHLVFQQ